jgi:hypothetical protein
MSYSMRLLLVALIGVCLPQVAVHAAGASLTITPAAGVFEVGGLVDISFVVDTGGQSINAVQADILFPPDKLQVVNPVASTSFISLWVTAPTYSNTDGTLHFQGGLPTPGIKTSSGVISTVTFRVKAAGPATIRYAASSRVLLNDGAGTNILTSSSTADITLKNPPPAGPIVTSPTHPDTNSWFNNPQAQFQWAAVDGALGYSYVFDQSSKTVPDETVDTTSTAVSVKATSDGTWYFHVRAKTEMWGGVTSVPIQIDATAPASFTPKFDRTTLTTEDVPTLRFVTTDAASGIDHYEVKQITVGAEGGVSALFIETSSPYTTSSLAEGTYEYIVRAFDRAGNNVDATTTLRIVASGLPFYASVPFLRNPAVANVTIVVLALAALTLVSLMIIRRLRLRDTFRHDLAALEHDAMRKTQALQRELEEIRKAQSFITPGTQGIAEQPAVIPTVPPPAPIVSPVAQRPAESSPYRYQAPPPPPPSCPPPVFAQRPPESIPVSLPF